MFMYCCEDATIVARRQPCITGPYGACNHDLAARCARALQSHLVPPNTEGAGKAGCALHPRSRVQDVHKNTHTSIQVQRRTSGLPCAVVYGLLRALLGEPSSFATVVCRSLFCELSASVGRQDHT